MAKELVIGGGMLEDEAGRLNAKLVEIREKRAERLAEILDDPEQAELATELQTPLEDYTPERLKKIVVNNLVASIDRIPTGPDGRLQGRKITDIMALEATIKKLRKFEEEDVFSVTLTQAQYDKLKAEFESVDWLVDNEFTKTPVRIAYGVLCDAGDKEE